MKWGPVVGDEVMRLGRKDAIGSSTLRKTGSHWIETSVALLPVQYISHLSSHFRFPTLLTSVVLTKPHDTGLNTHVWQISTLVTVIGSEVSIGSMLSLKFNCRIFIELKEKRYAFSA